MRKLMYVLLSVFIIASTGCSAGSIPPQKPLCRVVTEITVRENSGTGSRLCRYSDPKAMTKLLNYIRHLDPWDPADTGTAEGDSYFTITVYLSDGTEKIYEQAGLTCFRRPGDTWRHIPAEDGIRLPLLVEAIE